MQTDLIQILEKHDITLDRSILFGKIFAHDPKLFKFSLGEKIQLIEIAAAVTNILVTSGFGHFKAKSSVKCVRQPAVVECHILGKLFAENSLDEPDSATTDHKAKIFANITGIFRESNVDETTLNDFTDEMIKVSTEKGVLSASVECFLCKIEKPDTKSEFKVSAKRVGRKTYWTTSNFIKHIKKSHNDLKSGKHKRKSTKSRVSLSQIEESTECATQSQGAENAAADCFTFENIEVLEEFYKDLVTTDYDALQKSICRQISDHTIKMMEQCDANEETLKEMKFTCGLRCKPKCTEIVSN